MSAPNRIVCLTEETVETLYLLGEDARIVGVTGYAVRPPQVRREKTRVGAFTSANIGKILCLEPDLVLTFSDLQADIAAELIRAGVQVHAFNQRSVAGIFDMIQTLGALCQATERAEQLVEKLRNGIEESRQECSRLPRRPRIFFEEWDDPLISGIRWVSELIEIAGGVDIFAEYAGAKSASERIVTTNDVVERKPDIIIGSWCGKKFVPEKVMARSGFESLPAIGRGELHEIKSPIILQPGPAALTDGLASLRKIVQSWARRMT